MPLPPSTCLPIAPSKFFAFEYFNGEGEDGSQVLRADPSINVDSPTYRGMMPCASNPQCHKALFLMDPTNVEPPLTHHGPASFQA